MNSKVFILIRNVSRSVFVKWETKNESSASSFPVLHVACIRQQRVHRFLSPQKGTHKFVVLLPRTLGICSGLPRVREISGKNKIFSRSGKSQGILKKMSGNFGHMTHIREFFREFCHVMSVNCQGILL